MTIRPVQDSHPESRWADDASLSINKTHDDVQNVIRSAAPAHILRLEIVHFCDICSEVLLGRIWIDLCAATTRQRVESFRHRCLRVRMKDCKEEARAKTLDSEGEEEFAHACTN